MIKPDQAVDGGGEHPANCIRRKQADRRAVPERRTTGRRKAPDSVIKRYKNGIPHPGK